MNKAMTRVATGVLAALTATTMLAGTAHAAGGKIGMKKIRKHNSATSCWTAINGNVYDLTRWIAQHPGGQGAILSICGKNGSAAFNGQHGGNSRPQQMLSTFKIGTLK